MNSVCKTTVVLFIVILITFAFSFRGSCDEPHIAGLREPNEAEYYVRIPLDDFEKSKAKNPLLSEIPSVVRNNSVVVIINGKLIEKLRSEGKDVTTLKRKYSEEEFDILAQVGVMPLSSGSLINEHLNVTLYDDGNFSMRQASDGRYLLYPWDTSDISVKIDGTVYDIYALYNLSVSQPLSIDGNTATIKYTTPENVELTQRYILEGQACRFEMQAKNNGSTSRSVKVRYLFDTQIHENDGAPLYAPPVGTRVYEKDVTPLNFTQWQSWLDPVQDPGDLCGIGSVISLPTRVIFAWWPEAIDYPWDYSPDEGQRFYTPGYLTSPESDSCVVYYMDMGTLYSGSSAVVSTTYGNGLASGDDLTAVILALERLKNTSKDSIDYYRDQLAETYADAILAIRPTGGDAVKSVVSIGITFASFAMGDPSGAVDIAHSLGVSVEAVNALRSLSDALNLASLAFDGVELAQSLSFFLKSNEHVLRNGSRSDIEDAVKDWLNNSAEGFRDLFTGDVAAQKGLNGVKSRIDSVIDEYISVLQSTPPPVYPAEPVIEVLNSLSNTMVNARGREYLVIPLNDSLQYADFILGHAATMDGMVKEQISTYNAAETVSFVMFIGKVGLFGGKVALLVISGGGSAVAEFCIMAAGAVTTAVSLGSSVVSIQAEESIGILLKDYVASVASETSSHHGIPHGIVQYLKTFDFDDADIDNSGVSTTSFDIPDVALSHSEELAEVSGELVCENNTSNTLPVHSYALVFREPGIFEAPDEYPVMIMRSERQNVGPGASATLHYEPVLLPSDRYIANVYLVVGPTIRSNITGPMARRFQVSYSYQSHWNDIVDTVVLLSELAQGQQATETYAPGTEAVQTEFSLYYQGSDFDLHVYDSQNRHVGVNYQTGLVENEIPGAYYNGPLSPNELIRVPDPTTEDYEIKVIAVSSENPEGFTVLAGDIPEREGRLVVTPPSFESSSTSGYGEMDFLLVLSEAGGQEAVEISEWAATDLTGSVGSIPSSGIYFCNVPSVIDPGQTVDIGVSIMIPDGLGLGDYSGDLQLTWEGGTLDIPVLLHIVEPPPGLKLFWQNQNTGEVESWLLGLYAMPVGSPVTTGTSSSEVAVSGDIDGDGIEDLILMNSSGVVTFWMLNGDCTVKDTGTVDTAAASWYIVDSGDLDGDGTVDLIFRSSSGYLNCWLLSSNGTRESTVFIGGPVSDDWQIAASGDIDGDGAVDLFWRHMSSGWTAYWMLNPDGTRKGAGVIGNGPVPFSWQIEGAIDVNGDDIPDLLWRNSSGRLAYWEMNSDGSRNGNAGFIGYNVDLSWQVKATDDIDGDGVTDLIWRNNTTGDVAYWLISPYSPTKRKDAGLIGYKPLSWKINAVGRW